MNDLILRQIFDGSGFRRNCFEKCYPIVSHSLNGDLYTCTRGMLTRVEGKLLRLFARRDLFYEVVHSFLSVFTRVSVSYRQMREEAAYENHVVRLSTHRDFVALSFSYSLPCEMHIPSIPSSLQAIIQRRIWQSDIRQFIKSFSSEVNSIQHFVILN